MQNVKLNLKVPKLNWRVEWELAIWSSSLSFMKNVAHFLVPLTLNAASKTTVVGQLGSGTHWVKDPGEVEWCSNIYQAGMCLLGVYAVFLPSNNK